MLVWENRRELLVELQTVLCDKFDPNRFNIFVYGSFLTDKFTLYSDLDLAIYSNSLEECFGITETIEHFCTEQGLVAHPLVIRTETLGNFVDLEPLRLRVMLTDYFPDELKTYQFELMRMYAYKKAEYDSVHRKIKVWVEENNLDPEILKLKSTFR